MCDCGNMSVMNQKVFIMYKVYGIRALLVLNRLDLTHLRSQKISKDENVARNIHWKFLIQNCLILFKGFTH